MKVTFIGADPIYLDDSRAKTLMQAIASGQEYVIIDGEMYKSTTITAITKEVNETETEHRIGGVASGTGGLGNGERAAINSKGYEKFQAMRQRLLNK